MVDNLPTDTAYYYSFHVQQDGQELPPPKKINGIQDFEEEIMILGLYNRDSSKINVQVQYFAQRGDVDDGNCFYFSKVKMFVRHFSKKVNFGNCHIRRSCSSYSDLHWIIFKR